MSAGRAAAARRQVEVRHQWPPDFPAPSGRLAVIQPWEFGAIPQEWVGPIRATSTSCGCRASTSGGCTSRTGSTPTASRSMPNGVDLESFTPDGPRTRARRARLRLLFVGGLIAPQGPGRLLEAYREAFAGRDDVTLVIKDFGAAGVYPDDRPRGRPRLRRDRRAAAHRAARGRPVGRGHGRAVPGVRRARPALPRRGLRHAGARGDGLRPAGDRHRRRPDRRVLPAEAGWRVPAASSGRPSGASTAWTPRGSPRRSTRTRRRSGGSCSRSRPTRGSADGAARRPARPLRRSAGTGSQSGTRSGSPSWRPARRSILEPRDRQSSSTLPPRRRCWRRPPGWARTGSATCSPHGRSPRRRASRPASTCSPIPACTATRPRAPTACCGRRRRPAPTSTRAPTSRSCSSRCATTPLRGSTAPPPDTRRCTRRARGTCGWPRGRHPARRAGNGRRPRMARSRPRAARRVASSATADARRAPARRRRAQPRRRPGRTAAAP